MAKHPEIEPNNSTVFTSLFQMVKAFNTDDECREHLETLRWNGEPICPHCGSQRHDHYIIKTRGQYRGRYKCKDCRLPFSVTVGTIFEKSTVSLQKWFLAIYMFSSHKKGISSIQLAKDIGVTQKTAWIMLSKIRHSFKNDVDFQFESLVQMDETYVGGKNKNRNKSKRVKGCQGRSLKAKTPVFGMISEGLVYTEVVKDTRGETLVPIIQQKVKAGSTVVTDGWKGYKGLSQEYTHHVVKHNKEEYKKDGYHTNCIENFWGELKRGIYGIYHHVSPKHLQKYCDEFAFRYNSNNMSDGIRFNLALINSDVRLSYRELIS